MARVNVGINPRYISDQHLIAESVEITMITGQLKSHNFQIKSEIPEVFDLRKGHMTFFKNKLIYLTNRLYEVNCELIDRGFNPSTNINIDEFPTKLHNNWLPDCDSTGKVRKRVVERMLKPLKAKPNFHKYKRQPIDDIDMFVNTIINHDIFYV